jgi:hypothetical protein
MGYWDSSVPSSGHSALHDAHIASQQHLGQQKSSFQMTLTRCVIFLAASLGKKKSSVLSLCRDLFVGDVLFLV